jgi:nicotinamidase-related amidase
MKTIKEKSILICIDFINEIVSENGKLSSKGYFKYLNNHNSLKNVSLLQKRFRENMIEIIHVKISFKKEYIDHPLNSPLFGKAREYKALLEGS